MTPANNTLAAINRGLETKQESSHRAHLGASVIGDKCARKLWYLFRWSVLKTHPGQLLRLFNRGHLEEARFIEYLRGIGCEVWPHNPDELDPKTGEPRQWRISDHEGHFGGSLDGVGRGAPDFPPGEAFVTEYKTHGSKSFAKLLEMGVMGAKWEHFVQMQIYMHKMGLRWALYCAVNKDTDDLHLEVVRYDKEVAERALARAGEIIWADSPPERISASPGGFGCKFCDCNRLCHFGDVAPDRNCRTCRFASPAAAGTWLCGLKTKTLDDAAQRAACPSYQVNPKLQGIQP